VTYLDGKPYPPLNPKPDAAIKGIQGGNCNRTACQLPGANWYNRATHAYYCPACAKLINDANRVDAAGLYGSDDSELCKYQPKE